MNEPSSTATSTPAISAEAISRRAYEIWEREGRPDGADLRHWLQAERELGLGPAGLSDRNAEIRIQNGATESRERTAAVDVRPPARDGSRDGRRASVAAEKPSGGRRKAPNSVVL